MCLLSYSKDPCTVYLPKYIHHKSQPNVNVGINIPYMDPMGYKYNQQKATIPLRANPQNLIAKIKNMSREAVSGTSTRPGMRSRIKTWPYKTLTKTPPLFLETPCENVWPIYLHLGSFGYFKRVDDVDV